jgi:hypothetical protein
MLSVLCRQCARSGWGVVSAETDRLLREGVAAIRRGDLAAGRERLTRVVEADPFNAQAWLWLSAAVESKEDRIVCLENVLTVDPHHEAARRGLIKLGVEPPTPPPEPSAPPPPQTLHHTAPEAIGGGLHASLLGEKPGERPATRDDPPPEKREEDREAWRAALYDAHHVGSSATLVPTYEPPPQPTLGDLVRVWGDLLILNPHGGLNDELKHGGLGHTIVNIGMAGLLQAIAGALLVGVMLALAAAGVRPPLVASMERLLDQPVEADSGDVGTVGEALRAMGMFDVTVEGTPDASTQTVSGLPGGAALLIAAQAVLSIPAIAIGMLVYAFVTNALVIWLMEGKGDAIQTLQAVTLALVVGQVAQIPITALTPLLPVGAALFAIALVRIYQLAAGAVALNGAHKIGLLPSVGALVMGSAGAGAVTGGLCCGLSFLVSVLG